MSITTTQRRPLLARSTAQASQYQSKQQQQQQQKQAEETSSLQQPVRTPSLTGSLPTAIPDSAITLSLSTANSSKNNNNNNNDNSLPSLVSPAGVVGGTCDDAALPLPPVVVNEHNEEYEDDDSLPWPDHYPDPFPEKNPCFAKRTSATLETGVTLVYSCPEPVVVKNSFDGGGSKEEGGGGGGGVFNGGDGGRINEAEEGVRRITDKYAAPGSLIIKNGPVPSSSAASSILAAPTTTTSTTTATSSASVTATLSSSSTTTTTTASAAAAAAAGATIPKETLPSSPTPSITISAAPSKTAPSFVYNPFPPFNGGVPLSPTSPAGSASESNSSNNTSGSGGTVVGRNSSGSFSSALNGVRNSGGSVGGGTSVNSSSAASRTTTTAVVECSATNSLVPQQSSFTRSNSFNQNPSSSTFSRLSTRSIGGGGSMVVVNNYNNSNYNTIAVGSGVRLNSSNNNGGIGIISNGGVTSNRNSVLSRLSSTGSIGGVPVPGSGTLSQTVTMRNGGAKPLVLPPLPDPAFNPSAADAKDAPSPKSPGVTIESVRTSASIGGLGGLGGLVGGGTLTRGLQSVSGITLGNLGDGVTDQDVQQVEMFYRSHKSDVIVCPCLANFYIGAAASAPTAIELDVASSSSTTTSSASTPKPSTKNPKDKKGKAGSKDNKERGGKQPEKDQQMKKTGEGGGEGGEGGGEGDRQSSSSAASVPVSGSDSWEFVTTGIPLVVLDSGDHHRTRQLSIVVAEKGTGFVLWKDVISRLTKYSCPHANFHTLRVSTDSNKLGGLSFDDSKAAADFAASILKLTEDPEDELLLLSKKGKKNRKKQESMRKKQNKYKAPKKQDISQPCCFQHVTKLERPQLTAGVGMLLPPNSFPPAPSGSVSSLCDVMQDQLPLPLSRARSASSELSDGSTAASSDR